METWNDGARRMFGFTQDEARGTHLRQLLPSVDDDEWIRILKSLQSHDTAYFEAIGRRGDGSPVDVSVGLTPHLGPLGELAAVSAIIRDISESKAVQRLQNEFLAMTSHELRTPLTSIRGHAQLMLRHGTYERSHLELIVAASDQLGRLIEDLLLASRLEADRFDLHPAEIDLGVVLQLAVDQTAGATGRTIKIARPAEPLPVWGDQLRLRQVFANLLSNAVKYSPDGSAVSVQVRRSTTLVSVAVIDRGVGIPADDIPHLFDRFYRVAATAEQVQGAGLGLYITDRLVRAHGGRVTVESELQRGSVFTVTLALHRDDVGEIGSQDIRLANRLVEIGEDCATRLKEPYRSIDHAEALYDEGGLSR